MRKIFALSVFATTLLCGCSSDMEEYDFKDTDSAAANVFKTGGNGKELGLLAQEVEQVLPNVVLTDPDGNKLINYTAIIPVMIQAIKELNAEVENLKAGK